jgi:hypothetical protein
MVAEWAIAWLLVWVVILIVFVAGAYLMKHLGGN